MHNETHVVDVDAARGDVRSDNNGRVTVAEAFEVALAQTLRQVTVKVNCDHTIAGQTLRKIRSTSPGASEDDRTRVRCKQRTSRGNFFSRVRDEHVVLHQVRLSLSGIAFVQDMVRQMPAYEAVDVTVERRGQQHALAFARRLR